MIFKRMVDAPQQETKRKHANNGMLKTRTKGGTKDRKPIEEG